LVDGPQLVAERERLRKRVAQLERAASSLYVAPGHYYSPIPDPAAELAHLDTMRLDRTPAEVLAIDFNDAGQQALVEALAGTYGELPFADGPTPGLRYHFDNPYYGHGDAIMLYAMLRHLRPRRIVEIGSGYSSCVMLDTSSRFLDGQTACTFVEPYPDRLLSLAMPGDRERFTLVEQRLQDVDPGLFAALEPNDLLFIDSTHVSKLNSDVNYYLFEILPRLVPGVYVQIHDVFYPFEYPRAWLDENRAWNEQYLLRAFLQYNDAFSIVLFNAYLGTFHRALMERSMPRFLDNPGGGLWLRRR
jgi:hypothetical protein